MANISSFGNENVIRPLNLINFNLPSSTYVTQYIDVSKYTSFSILARASNILSIVINHSVDASGVGFQEINQPLAPIVILNVMTDLGNYPIKSRFLRVAFNGTNGSQINFQMLFHEGQLGQQANSLSNLGSGVNLFDVGLNGILSLTSNDNSVIILSNGTEVDLSAQASISNVGTGEPLYVAPGDLKTLTSNDNSIVITSNATEVDLSAVNLSPYQQIADDITPFSLSVNARTSGDSLNSFGTATNCQMSSCTNCAHNANNYCTIDSSETCTISSIHVRTSSIVSSIGCEINSVVGGGDNCFIVSSINCDHGTSGGLSSGNRNSIISSNNSSVTNAGSNNSTIISCDNCDILTGGNYSEVTSSDSCTITGGSRNCIQSSLTSDITGGSRNCIISSDSSNITVPSTNNIILSSNLCDIETGSTYSSIESSSNCDITNVDFGAIEASSNCVISNNATLCSIDSSTNCQITDNGTTNGSIISSSTSIINTQADFCNILSSVGSQVGGSRALGCSVISSNNCQIVSGAADLGDFCTIIASDTCNISPTGSNMAIISCSNVDMGYVSTGTKTLACAFNSLPNPGGGANSSFSLIGAGQNGTNNASFSYATILGSNWTNNHLGNFMWTCNGGGTNHSSLSNNGFSARCSGGARFFSNTSNTTGVTLAIGSNAWAAVSDRNVKENLMPVNNYKILERVKELPIYEYNFIGNPKEIRCIGPMAQDWHKIVTPLEQIVDRKGTRDAKDKLTIESMDMLGILLACVQQLSKEVEELKKLIH